MNRRMKIEALLLATASLLCLTQAHAQSSTESVQMSPGTSNVGTIDVQGAGETLGSGFIIPEDGPKDRSTVTHQGIENLAPTANPFQVIDILPGVNEFQEDALGLSGGTLRVRGLRADEMGYTINGVPLNDSGTFNVYPAEFIDTENLDAVWVTKGSTDIDAPHVGASGGNIGIVTRAPLDTFTVKAEEMGGEDDLVREFISVDSGWIGNFKGFASFSDATVDKWRGDGTDNRMHSDGNLLWQFLPHSSAGLTWAYNDAVDHYYRDYAGGSSYNVYTSGLTALQTFDQIGTHADYDTFWGSSSAYPITLGGLYSTGSCSTHPNPSCTVTNPNYPTTASTNESNAWGLQINPYKNFVVNAPINVQLLDNLRWDTNPYFWFGNGGAGFGTNEAEGCCVNGFQLAPEYGVPSTSAYEILTYETTTNNTLRPGVTTKFVYDLDNYTFSLGGWIEHSRLFQWEHFGLVNSNLTPCDTWLTSTAGNPCVIDGTSVNGTGPAYAYKYVADTVGKSIFFQAQGSFLDDALKVSAGLSDRAISRSVHNDNPICADDPSLGAPNQAAKGVTCASYATSSAFLESAAYQYFNGPTVGPAAAYAAMQRFGANPHVGASYLLPEFTLTYDIDPKDEVFAGLSTGFHAPTVSNYSSFTSGNSATSSNIMKLTDVKPEFAYSYEAGYRFHGDFLTASTAAFLQDVRDYQATVQIDPADYITSNIGTVKIYGIDGEAGTKPWHGLTLYGSAVIQNSVLSQNIQADYTGTYPNDSIEYVNTKGKQLVDTPNWVVSLSIGYEENGFFGNVIPHCYGQRATALLNDEYVPANCTVNASFGYHFGEQWGYLRGATLQVYAINMTNSAYFGEIYTQGQTNAKEATGYAVNQTTHAVTTGVAVPSQSYTGEPGAPVFIGAKLSVIVGD